ncbi:MAG: hypothetical protein IPK16_32500 [Anaerolineales bacterium]|nr:hypothetical protein [Anaerolineales bacterium]
MGAPAWPSSGWRRPRAAKGFGAAEPLPPTRNLSTPSGPDDSLRKDNAASAGDFP